eukprot:GHVR01065820.1.p2 GENE.GHVR01065820.1~~GHVR01065820.1.p2  ORF type:complete len:129 (-),score=19.86 GHVR01065820.1:70-456(-)
MFASICLYCAPSDPLSLWMNHKEALIEDFVEVQRCCARNMRAGINEQVFADWLLGLGDGKLSCGNEDFPTDSIFIPSECNVVVDDIVKSVLQDASDPEKLTTTIILTPTNESSLDLNNDILKLLPEPT